MGTAINACVDVAVSAAASKAIWTLQLLLLPSLPAWVWPSARPSARQFGILSMLQSDASS